MADLLQNHTSTFHTIRAHAQEVCGSCELGRKVATHDSKSDLPLVLNVTSRPLSSRKKEQEFQSQVRNSNKITFSLAEKSKIIFFKKEGFLNGPSK